MLNINIPTRGRPKKVEDCLNSIDYSGDYSVFLYCHNIKNDLPDPACMLRHKYCYIIEDPDILTIESHNKICANQGHFMGLSDDIVFHPGALDAAVWILENELQGFGIVDFTVSNMKSPDGCYMLLGDSFIEGFPSRTPYCPIYKFMFASAELRDYAKSMKCFLKSRIAKLDHFHPVATGRADTTHTRIRSQGIIQNDNAIYVQRKAAGQLWSHLPAGQKPDISGS